MPYFKNFNYTVEGNSIDYTEGKTQTASALSPNQGMTFGMPAVAGLMQVRISGLNFSKPVIIRHINPHTDPHDPNSDPFIELYNHVPLRVELFAPGQSSPLIARTTEDKPTEEEETTFQQLVGSAGSPSGNWELRLTNVGKVAAKVFAEADFVFDRLPLETTNLPLRLLDHAYDLILEALIPRARISGNVITVSFGSDLLRLFRTNPPPVLGTHQITLPSVISGTGELKCVDLEACSGQKLLSAMLARWQQVQSDIDAAVVKAQTMTEPLRSTMLAALQQRRDKNDAWRRQFENRVKPDFATIHAWITFSNVQFELDLDRIDLGPLNPLKPHSIPLGEVRDALIHIFVAFNPILDGVVAMVLSPIKLTGALARAAETIGVIPDVHQAVEEQLPGIIESVSAPFGLFLAETLARLSAGPAVFMRLNADEANWRVQHTAVPAEHLGTGIKSDAAIVDVSSPPPSTPTAADAASPFPPEFIVPAPETLSRLDKIQTIVVIMMENRSFDHMLGYLLRSRGPKYEGLQGGESNVVAGRTDPVGVIEAREVIGAPSTAIQFGPNHSFSHVRDQINGGKMSGFAQDYGNIVSSLPEVPMTFYTGADLETYDHLAASYKVCDHWFAAHPGPTWPNRWTTLGGTPLEIDNPDLDDPRMGFIMAPTIFDLLDAHAIDWRVFESDLSLVRTYNRYRLNVDKVVPYFNRRDPTQSFAKLAEQGKLPPVVFVEPNFSDIPPLSTANDDLAPVDVRRGQRFVRDVYASLTKNPDRWRSTLLLVTYDEHGGFFDHVPPPGTPLGPKGFLDSKGKSLVPKIHPNGADHLGVRVPALLASPLINAGDVSKVVFDHTSIIKTILLRHRARITGKEFTMFGPRVNQAAHLGQALDLDVPRTDVPAPPPRRSLQPRPVGEAERAAAPLKSLGDDFHESLRRAFLPRAQS